MNNDDYFIPYFIGNMYFLTAEYKKARSEYRQGLDMIMSDKNVTNDVKKYYQVKTEKILGNCFYKEGFYKEAIQHYDAAIAMGGGIEYAVFYIEDALFNKAKSYEKIGDKKNALVYYKLYLANSNPQDSMHKQVEKITKSWK